MWHRNQLESAPKELWNFLTGWNKIKSNYIVLWCSAMDSVRQRDGGNHMMKNSAIRCIRSANRWRLRRLVLHSRKESYPLMRKLSIFFRNCCRNILPNILKKSPCTICWSWDAVTRRRFRTIPKTGSLHFCIIRYSMSREHFINIIQQEPTCWLRFCGERQGRMWQSFWNRVCWNHLESLLWPVHCSATEQSLAEEVWRWWRKIWQNLRIFCPDRESGKENSCFEKNGSNAPATSRLRQKAIPKDM